VTTPFRVLVCGTNFGRFYAEAVQARPGYELVGLLTRGSESSRAYADKLAVPLYTDLAQLPEQGIDLACVVVGSAISGGSGTELALDLINRGINVLQEHPLHLDELTACIRQARRGGVHYRINTHYPHIDPVREFIAAARRLTSRQRPLFVDAATPIHLMLPLVDILSRALGSLRPRSFAEPAPLPQSQGSQPFRMLHGVLGEVPLTLRVHHELDPADRDNHALHWHRITIGTEGGVLTLADTHGPVLWSPRLHAERDADHRFVLDGPGTDHLDLPTTSVLGEPGTFREVFTRLWPDAVGRALDAMRDAIRSGPPGTVGSQHDLSVCQAWSDLTARLGPPALVRPPKPAPLPVRELFPEPHDDEEAPASYTSTAEFFDLVAAEHTATSSAPAVAVALAGLDVSAGPIVDLGAGTGLVTEAVARALPEARVLAAEPSVGMRAVLTSRMLDDPDLQSRVTVTDGAAPDLDLPERISAAVLCGVLGHLDPDQRRRLWKRLLDRLAPGGRIVVELMQCATPVELPETRLASTVVGRCRYEWWFSGAPESATTMRLRSLWRVFDEEGGDAPVREVCDEYRWEPFGFDLVAAESGLHPHVVQGRPGAPPLAVLTRQPPDVRTFTPEESR